METPQPMLTQTGSFSEDGTSGRITTTLKFSGGTKTGPGFTSDYTITVPAGNIYEIFVSADDYAIVSGAGISASSHWDASKKSIVSGFSKSTCKSLENIHQKETFTINYRNAGGPYVLTVEITSTREVHTPCECTQSSNWVQNGDVQVVSMTPVDVHIEHLDGGNGGDFIPYGIITWEITGKVTCICRNSTREVFVKKNVQRKKTANINTVKLVGALPPGATTIPQLLSSIFAEAILWKLNEKFINHHIPHEGKAAFENFLNRLNTPPRIDSGFWTGDLCNETQNK